MQIGHRLRRATGPASRTVDNELIIVVRWLHNPGLPGCIKKWIIVRYREPGVIENGRVLATISDPPLALPTNSMHWVATHSAGGRMPPGEYTCVLGLLYQIVVIVLENGHTGRKSCPWLPQTSRFGQTGTYFPNLKSLARRDRIVQELEAYLALQNAPPSRVPTLKHNGAISADKS